MKLSRPSINCIICLLGLVCIAAIAFGAYWTGQHRLWDDYPTSVKAGPGNWLEGGKNITQSLDELLRRFQPVRLYAYSLAIHLVPEEATFGCIFALHLLNAILLFFLVRKFDAGNLAAFLVAVQFCIYAVPRHIYSLSTTVGGSALCTMFMLVAVLAMINGARSAGWKKWLWLAGSWLMYVAFVFSYETAFPMLVPVLLTWAVFFYFIPKRSFRRHWGWWLVSIPYVAVLVCYFVFFYGSQTAYPTAKIAPGGDSLVRLATYSTELLSPFYGANLNLAVGFWAMVAAVVFLTTIIASAMISDSNRNVRDVLCVARRTGLFLPLFGLTWYLATVCLFCLSQYKTPSDVYYGHLYLMIPGMSMFLVGLIVWLARWLSGAVRAVAMILLLAIIAPAILLSEVNYNLNQGRALQAQERIWSVVRDDVRRQVRPETTDGVLIKNLLEPQGLIFCAVGDMDGAMLEWAGFKKRIYVGDNVVSCRDGKITFASPLSCYATMNHVAVRQAANDRTEIFYYDSQTHHLLPYHDNIDLKAGVNSYQCRKVRIDYLRSTGPFEAILKNAPDRRWLRLKFGGKRILDSVGKMYLRINDEPMAIARMQDDCLCVDVSRFSQYKYLFIHANIPDDERFVREVANVDFVAQCGGSDVMLAGHGQMPSLVGEDVANYGCMYLLNPTVIGKYFSISTSPVHSLVNWTAVDLAWCRVTDSRAAFSLKLPPVWPDTKKCSMVLVVRNIDPSVRQYLEVKLNGKSIGRIFLSDTGSVGQRIRMSFDASFILPGLDNRVEFVSASPVQADATKSGFCVSSVGFEQGAEDPFPAWNQPLAFNSMAGYIQFDGWYDPEGSHRWAKGAAGKIRLVVPSLPDKATAITMQIKGFTLGDQQVQIYFNGHRVADVNWKSGAAGDSGQIIVPIDVVRPEEFNVIEIRSLFARRASDADERILGFAFQELVLDCKAE